MKRPKNHPTIGEIKAGTWNEVRRAGFGTEQLVAAVKFAEAFELGLNIKADSNGNVLLQFINSELEWPYIGY